MYCTSKREEDRVPIPTLGKWPIFLIASLCSPLLFCSHPQRGRNWEEDKSSDLLKSIASKVTGRFEIIQNQSNEDLKIPIKENPADSVTMKLNKFENF